MEAWNAEICIGQAVKFQSPRRGPAALRRTRTAAYVWIAKRPS